jgi:DNA-binding transcriptional ArsR family regulator
MDKHIRERVTVLFSALANPTRLRIIEFLMESGRSVNEIAAGVQISQSSASQHLMSLTRAGVLVVEQKGATRLYRIRGPRIVLVLALFEEFCTIHRLSGPEDPAEPLDGIESHIRQLAGVACN